MSDEQLQVLGKSYCLAILRILGEPMSAKQVSSKLDIPIATTYRRIDELEEVGLITLHDRRLSDEHRRTNVYRRAVKTIHVEWENNEQSIETTKQRKPIDVIDSAWRNLA